MDYLTLLTIILILCLIPFVGGKPNKKGSIDTIKNWKWWAR